MKKEIWKGRLPALAYTANVSTIAVLIVAGVWISSRRRGKTA